MSECLLYANLYFFVICLYVCYFAVYLTEDCCSLCPDDVDLDALLDDLNKFDPREQQQKEEAQAVPPLPVKEPPVARPPAPEPEPDVDTYQQIGGAAVIPVDKPPELPARSAAMEMRSETSHYRVPAVSNGGVHQVDNAVVHPPPAQVIPEAKEVHLTGSL